MVFLSKYPSNPSSNILQLQNLKAKIYYLKNKPNMWILSVYNADVDYPREVDYYFYLPKQIFEYWKTLGLNPTEALNMKERYFSKIFVFNGNTQLPISIIRIDEEWLRSVREHRNNE